MLTASWRLWLATLGIVRGCSALTIIKQLSSCSVETDEGTVDLTPLAQTTGGPRFDFLAAGLGDYYSWNPCVDYTEPGDQGTQDGCGKIAACQQHAGGFYGLGTQASATFIINSQGYIEIQYKSAYGSRTAHVQLQCQPSQSSTQVTAAGEEQTDNYYYTVVGNITCPVKNADFESGGGITAGSVLLIVFFTTIFVYLVFGALYMKLRKNATGKEIIPNYNTWALILTSAKEGAIFVLRRKRPGYESY